MPSAAEELAGTPKEVPETSKQEAPSKTSVQTTTKETKACGESDTTGGVRCDVLQPPLANQPPWATLPQNVPFTQKYIPVAQYVVTKNNTVKERKLPRPPGNRRKPGKKGPVSMMYVSFEDKGCHPLLDDGSTIDNNANEVQCLPSPDKVMEEQEGEDKYGGVNTWAADDREAVKERISAYRRKQVEKFKVTQQYVRYMELRKVAREKRTESDAGEIASPRSSDVSMSKRQWNRALEAWSSTIRQYVKTREAAKTD